MPDSLPPTPEQIARDLREIAGFLSAIAAQAPREPGPAAKGGPVNGPGGNGPGVNGPAVNGPGGNDFPKPGLPGHALTGDSRAEEVTAATTFWMHALTSLVPASQQAAVREALVNTPPAGAPRSSCCATLGGDALANAGPPVAPGPGVDLPPPPAAEIVPAI
ncbi:MAG: hypothetical protein ACKOFW_15225 [Planctomycetaceae bacterium]